MIRLLPFILIPIFIIAILGYWRFSAQKPKTVLVDNSSTITSDDTQEVPKTLPDLSVDDKVADLESTVSKLTSTVNSLKSATPQTSNSSMDARLANIESSITTLKAQVASLQNATPAPAAASSQSVVYIPLGSGGGPWANQAWYSTAEYQITLDPANYPNYKAMYLEVTFRLTEAAGTGSVRLYNTTNSSATSSQLNTTSVNLSTFVSSSFTLPTGSNTYTLQVQSSENKNVLIQTARIRVTF